VLIALNFEDLFQGICDLSHFEFIDDSNQRLLHVVCIDNALQFGLGRMIVLEVQVGSEIGLEGG
jgi:hypothetical protein